MVAVVQLLHTPLVVLLAHVVAGVDGAGAGHLSDIPRSSEDLLLIITLYVFFELDWLEGLLAEGG